MASRPDYQFGDFAGGHDVDLILYQLIDRWLLTYLYEIARRSGEEFDELKPFRSWRVSTELEKMPEDQSPALIIVNQGLSDNPVKRGSNRPGQSFYATWAYQFGCLASAKGKKVNAAPRAIRLSQMYCMAVRLILIQKRDDEGMLGMLDWMDESYDGLDSEDDRTICLSHTDFWVNIPAAATWANGPMEPVPDPIPDSPVWPIVVSADVDVIKQPQEEPFPEPVPPIPPEPPRPEFKLSSWIMRPQQNSDNMFPGDVRMNWGTAAQSDLLWVHKQDGMLNDDHSTELMALVVGDRVRLSYPLGGNDSDGATWDLTANPVDGGGFVELAVANSASHGALEDHFGEDVDLFIEEVA